MKIAYLDTISGISGDMTLGAFVDAGMPLDLLRSELSKVELEEYSIVASKVSRNAISATRIEVETPARSNGSTPEHSHAEHAHDHHRPYSAIRDIIQSSGLSERVRKQAQAMFHVIAVAEAKIHDTTPDEVSFHEVGAVDSIVDIVGIAICLEYFAIDRVTSGPVRTGSGGLIHTQHGIMPVPAPATIEILKGYPVELTDVPFELATPTGAAVIAALSDGIFDRSIDFRIERTGYGAGSREIPGMPNVLRVMIGETDRDSTDERLRLLETNIDDMNTEVYPYVIERLLESGANDAWISSVLMKKGRPGFVLSVLCEAETEDALLKILHHETTTTGVRIQDVRRIKLDREVTEVETGFGIVRVKRIHRGEKIQFAPEYEECRRIALERKIPLLEVYRILERELGEKI